MQIDMARKAWQDKLWVLNYESSYESVCDSVDSEKCLKICNFCNFINTYINLKPKTSFWKTIEKT